MKKRKFDSSLVETQDTGEYMCQCSLEKHDTTSVRRPGIKHMTVWLPEKFAVVGKFLKLHKYNEWDNGWEVKSIAHKMLVDECRERSRDYCKQRKASDI